MTAYDENHEETLNSVLEGDVVCVALLKFLETEPEREGPRAWKGKPEALLTYLNTHAAPGATRSGSGWPPNPQALSGRLRMATKILAQVGVTVMRKRTGRARSLHILWVSGKPLQDVC